MAPARPSAADPRRKRLSDTGLPAYPAPTEPAMLSLTGKLKAKEVEASTRPILPSVGDFAIPSVVPDAVERCFSTLSCSGLKDRTVSLQGTGNLQGSGVTVTYGVCTQGGMDPGGTDKDNQDGWVIVENFGNTSDMFLGVFDGHGTEGRKISSALVQQLPNCISSSAAYKAHKYQAAINEQFLECNNAIKRTATINCALSGSTAITALLQGGRKLLVANVGDSRCMLGQLGLDGKVTAVALSSDHSPDVASEAQRIQSNKGRVGSYMYNGTTVGPLRVWLADQDIPGLSMTRAFGDTVASSVGIIAEPEFKEVMLQPRDKYLVLCSDGIFEFMTNQEIMQIVHDKTVAGCSPSQIGATLVEKARQHWLKEEEDVIDDCTVIVCVLDVALKAKLASAAAVPELQPQRTAINGGLHRTSSSSGRAAPAPQRAMSMKVRAASLSPAGAPPSRHSFDVTRTAAGPAASKGVSYRQV